jgi:RHS repeat-associated protein
MRRLGLTALTIIVCLTLVIQTARADGPGYQAPLLARGNAVELLKSNGFTGDATASIPIAVSPGRGGLQPSVAIGYSSSAGNSAYGYGWNYDPGSIDRSTKNGTPRNFSTADQFLLDGQDLVRLSDANCTDTAAFHCFHTKQESFLKIQGYLNAALTDYDYWVVYDKSGTKYEYGTSGTADGAAEAVGKAGVTRKWGLRQVTDTNGNTYSITYMKDATNSPGALYPDLISYTGGAVDFVWESGRPDVFSSYRDGGLVKTYYRLNYVDVKVGSTNLLRRYDLSYTTSSTNRSLLTSVQEKGSDGTTALPARTFEYSTSAGSGFDAWTISFAPCAAPNGTSVRMMDLNGDGLPDVVDASAAPKACINNGNGTFTQNTGWTWGGFTTFQSTLSWSCSIAYGSYSLNSFTADFDGDGLEDIATTTSGYQPNVCGWVASVVTGYRNTGNGFVLWSGFGYPPLSTVAASYSGGGSLTFSDEGPGRRIMDVNGDGLPDVVDDWTVEGSSCSGTTTATPAQQVYINNGNGAFSLVPWSFPGIAALRFATYYYNWSKGGSCSNSAPNYWSVPAISMADSNGDGLDEPTGYITDRGSSGFVTGGATLPAAATVFASYTDGSYCSSGCSETFTDNGTGRRLMDLNGDGLPDVMDAITVAGYGCNSYPTTVTPTRRAYLNQGNGTFTEITWNFSGVIFSTYMKNWSYGGSCSTTTWPSYWQPNTAVAVMADFNGDGFAEPLGYKNTGTKPDLLKKATTGLGGSVSYAYQIGNSSGDKVPMPVMVVSSLTTDDGLGTIGTTSYSYAGAYWKPRQSNSVPAEFRGFESVTATDPAGNKTITHYYQGDGSPAGDTEAWKGQVNYSVAGGNDLTESNAATFYVKTVNTYAADASAPFFAPLTQVDTYAYEHTATPKQSEMQYTYDAYGNALTAYNLGDTAVSSDESRTTNEYITNTTNWIFKLMHSYTEGFKPGDVALTKYRESWSYYDGASYGTLGSPAKGNLTQSVAWLNGGTDVLNTFGYNAYGNVIWTKDGRAYAGEAGVTNSLGHTSDITYDATYQTYVASVRDAKDFVTTTAYDSLMRPTSVTDPNSQVTSTEYDVFSRVTKVVRPGDSSASPTAAYTYGIDGVAPEYMQVTAKDGSADGLTYTYYDDGLGRPAGDAVDAQNGGWVRTNTYYDNRGLVQAQSVPYLSSNSPAQAQTVVEAEGSSYSHVCGTAQGNVWMSPNAGAGSCYLTYGPYQAPSAIGPGQVVRFWLAIDVATGNNDAVAVVDVYDSTAGQQIASRTLYRNEFGGGLANLRDFALTFDTTGRAAHNLEYRVSWSNPAKMAHDKTAVLWNVNNDLVLEAEGSSYSHVCGTAQGNVWMSPNAGAGSCYLTYGPYQAPSAIGPGQVVRFWLAIDVATGNNDAVAVVDVYDSTAGQQIASRTLYRNEFGGGLANFRDFALTFDTTGRVAHNLEYRVFWSNPAKMAHDKTIVSWRGTNSITAYTYDPLGRATQTTYPDGTTSTAAYAPWQVTASDALGHQKVTIYNAYGQPAQVKECTGSGSCTVYATTNYNYNTGTGELVKVTDQKTNVTTLAYDTLGRKTQSVDPDMGTWNYTYDANGNLLTQTDAKGQVLWFKYDGLNRVLEKRQTNSTGALLAAYTYDNTGAGSFYKGRLYQVVANGFTRQSTYDTRGRVATEKLLGDAKTWLTSYAYDAMDRVTSVTYPGGNAGQAGEVVNNTYNAQGLPATVAGTSTYLSSANYNAFGRIADMTFGNTVKTTYNYYDTSSEQDPTALVYFSYRLKNILVQNNAATPVTFLNLTYKYDKVGNVKNVDDGLDATKNQTFTYDDLYRLLSASTTATGYYGSKTYTYNEVGNILTKDARTYTYSGVTHRVTNDGTYDYCYDANGNIVKRGTGGAACPTVNLAFTYNYDNMPTTIGSETYTYDQAGTRIKKVAGGVTTYYVNQYYEEENGVAVKHYFANGQRIATRDSAGLKFNHSDHLGSASRTSNTAAPAALIRTIRYDPWGTTQTAWGSGTAVVKYTYTDKEKDATGLMYYGARYYEPVLGRFTTPDSIVPNLYDPQSLNRYSYVRNNPVRLVDPTGHQSVGYENYGISFNAKTSGGWSVGIQAGDYVNVGASGDKAGATSIDLSVDIDVVAVNLSAGNGSTSVGLEALGNGATYEQTPTGNSLTTKTGVPGASLTYKGTDNTNLGVRTTTSKIGYNVDYLSKKLNKYINSLLPDGAKVSLFDSFKGNLLTMSDKTLGNPPGGGIFSQEEFFFLDAAGWYNAANAYSGLGNFSMNITGLMHGSDGRYAVNTGTNNWSFWSFSSNGGSSSASWSSTTSSGYRYGASYNSDGTRTMSGGGRTATYSNGSWSFSK